MIPLHHNSQCSIYWKLVHSSFEQIFRFFVALSSIYILNISFFIVILKRCSLKAHFKSIFQRYALSWQLLNLLRNKLHSQCANSSRFQQIEPSNSILCLDCVQSNAKFMECRDSFALPFFSTLICSARANGTHQKKGDCRQCDMHATVCVCSWKRV